MSKPTRTFFVRRGDSNDLESCIYNEEVKVGSSNKTRIDPLDRVVCYTGWLRRTGIKLMPGEVRKFRVVEVK